MGALALLDVFSYVDGTDFTGESNETRLNLDRVPLDNSRFRGGGWRALQGGARSAAFVQNGFWTAGGDSSVDAVAFNQLGTTGRVHTFGPQEAEGELAYFWKSGHFQYQLFNAPLGQLAPFALSGSGTDEVGVVRGRLGVAPWETVAGVPTQVITDSVGPIGSGVQLGAVAADEFLLATVHLLADVGAGDDITIDIESDDNSGFTTPTVRATLGPLTARGGTWLTPVPGAITDTWWRFVVDDITAATTGEFVIAAAFGVQGGWL